MLFARHRRTVDASSSGAQRSPELEAAQLRVVKPDPIKKPLAHAAQVVLQNRKHLNESKYSINAFNYHLEQAVDFLKQYYVSVCVYVCG